MLCIYLRLLFILANKMANSLLRRPSLNPPPPPSSLLLLLLFLAVTPNVSPTRSPRPSRGEPKKGPPPLCAMHTAGFIPAFFYTRSYIPVKIKRTAKCHDSGKLAIKQILKKGPIFNSHQQPSSYLRSRYGGGGGGGGSFFPRGGDSGPASAASAAFRDNSRKRVRDRGKTKIKTNNSKLLPFCFRNQTESYSRSGCMSAGQVTYDKPLVVSATNP